MKIKRVEMIDDTRNIVDVTFESEKITWDWKRFSFHKKTVIEKWKLFNLGGMGFWAFLHNSKYTIGIDLGLSIGQIACRMKNGDVFDL